MNTINVLNPLGFHLFIYHDIQCKPSHMHHLCAAIVRYLSNEYHCITYTFATCHRTITNKVVCSAHFQLPKPNMPPTV